MNQPYRPPGVISATEADTLDELKARLRIEDRAWWKLRDLGLRFTIIGKNRVILGSDVIRILQEHAETHSQRTGK